MATEQFSAAELYKALEKVIDARHPDSLVMPTVRTQLELLEAELVSLRRLASNPEAELAQKRRLDLSDKITEQRAKDCAYCECLSEIRQEHWNTNTGRCDWCKLPFPGGNAGVKQLEANQ